MVDSSRIKSGIEREKREREKRMMMMPAFLLFPFLYYYNIESCSNNDVYVSEIHCLDKMQSRGQLYLTRLQLNVHVLISACRARTRAYVSGLDIECKEEKKERKNTSN